jgi:phage replication-related protein YjqB (UPF0714/DUF867 family)
MLVNKRLSKMASFYQRFKDLEEHEVEGQDYQITMNLRGGPILIMAPHGGRIEPMTAEIAEAISGATYSFYAFEGLKTDGNGFLHIESHLFDEPRAMQAVEKAHIVVTVHGQIDHKEEFVMVGGLNDKLRKEIMQQLEASGFQTRLPTERLMGTDPQNICNRGKLKQGVQLEVSRKIRDIFRTDIDQLQIFAKAVRKAIQLYFQDEGVGDFLWQS